jgi:hypothetical protein
VSGSETDKKLTGSASVRYIPDKGPNGRWTTSAQLHYDRYSLGVDYRPLTENVGPIASVRVLDERENSPSLMLGTGPDVFNSTRAQAYFAMLSKQLFKSGDFSLSPFVGGAYIDELDAKKALGGLSARFKEASMMLYHNGFDPHLILSYDVLDKHTLSFVYWGLEMPGAAYSYKF